MQGHGILTVRDLNTGTIIKQGDQTTLKFQLMDYNDDTLNLSSKPVEVVLMTTDFTQKTTIANTTVGADNVVSFSIMANLLPTKYYMEFVVDGKYIFPSEHRHYWTITPSSKGSDINLIQMVGVDELVSRIVPMVEIGAQGPQGYTPTIGANGNWYINGTDTGKPARGPKGDTFTFNDLTSEQVREIKESAIELQDYVTKEQAQFDFQPKGNYLTEAQSDSRYHPLTEGVVTLTDKQFEQEIAAENLVKNGDELTLNKGWSVYTADTQKYSGYTKITSTNGKAGRAYRRVDNLISGNLKYVFVFMKTTNSKSGLSNGEGLKVSHSGSGQIELLSDQNIYGYNVPGVYIANGSTAEVHGIGEIDLTAIFGAGNEPTKEEMDSYMKNAVINWANDKIVLNTQVSISTKMNWINSLLDFSPLNIDSSINNNLLTINGLKEKLTPNESKPNVFGSYIDLQLKPNTTYTLSTDHEGQYSNVFLHNPSLLPSTTETGALKNKPRSYTTDDSGVARLSFHVSNTLNGTVDDYINGTYHAKLEEGESATKFIYSVEDKDYIINKIIKQIGLN